MPNFLPTVAEWIRRTLEGYSRQKRSVASFKFPRLSKYFSPELLNSASVVVTHPLPVPPLSALGLSEFVAFESQSMSGITFLDTYFLLPGDAGEESLHFHELVHVIQWQVLGPKDFLLFYAAGLALGHNHAAAATRTFPGSEFLRWRCADGSRACGTPEDSTTNRKASCSPTVGEKTEVADANEPSAGRARRSGGETRRQPKSSRGVCRRARNPCSERSRALHRRPRSYDWKWRPDELRWRLRNSSPNYPHGRSAHPTWRLYVRPTFTIGKTMANVHWIRPAQVDSGFKEAPFGGRPREEGYISAPYTLRLAAIYD
jgi:hypothetical protein